MKKTRHFVNGFPHSMEYHLISYIALLSTLLENPESPDNLERPDFLPHLPVSRLENKKINIVDNRQSLAFLQ